MRDIVSQPGTGVWVQELSILHETLIAISIDERLCVSGARTEYVEMRV